MNRELSSADRELADELYPKAVDALKVARRASVSVLQRRLRIGYLRATRLMALLEQFGVVGPEQGIEPRKILVDLDTPEGHTMALNAAALAGASDPDGDEDDRVGR